MVLRIVVDVARRKWRTAVWGIFQFYLPVQAVTQVWPWIDPMGIVLCGAGLLATTHGLALQSRELYQLPVSRRTWSEAQWWVAAGTAATIPVIGVTIGLWVRQSKFPSVEGVALYSIFAFLYCGCALALRRTFSKWADAPATLKNLGFGGPVLMAFLFAPLRFGAKLPHRFEQISPISGAALVLMSIWAWRGYNRHPAITPRPGRGGPSLLTAWKQEVTGQTDSKIRSSRSTGLQFAFRYETRVQALTFAFVIAASIAAWFVVSVITPMPQFTEFLRMADALPFASARASRTEVLTWGLVLFFAGNVREPWIFNDRRHLRSLPLSPIGISWLPIAIASLSTLTLWAVLLLLHLLVLRSVPVSPRFDLFLAYAGFSAFGHVLRLIGPSSAILKGILPLFPISAVILTSGYFMEQFRFRPEIAQPSVLVFGAFLLILSFVTLWLWTTRSSKMYRRVAAVPPG